MRLNNLLVIGLTLAITSTAIAAALCSSCQQRQDAINEWEGCIDEKEQDIACCEHYIRVLEQERVVKQLEVSLLLQESPVDHDALSAVLAEIDAIDAEIAENRAYINTCGYWIQWYTIKINASRNAMDGCDICN